MLPNLLYAKATYSKYGRYALVIIDFAEEYGMSKVTFLEVRNTFRSKCLKYRSLSGTFLIKSADPRRRKRRNLVGDWKKYERVT